MFKDKTQKNMTLSTPDLRSTDDQETQKSKLVDEPRTLDPVSLPVCLNKRGEVTGQHEVQGFYGWCSINPSCFQFMVNRKAFLIVFCFT